MKKSITILLAFLLICGAVLGYARLREDLRSWVRKNDEAVVAAINRGAAAYAAGDLETAEKAYAQAEGLAARADADAEAQWNRRSPKDGAKTEGLKPRDRFLAGKDNPLYRGGVHYFKNRVSEAAYGLALCRYQMLKTRYRIGDGAAFAPPSNVLAPALDALERGLKACPQSESLRLLKAEILAGSGRYNQALKVLEEILLLDPKSAEAYNQMALVYSSRMFLLNTEDWKKNQEKALELFQKAALGTTLDGGRLPDPLLNLGMFYATPDPTRAENAPPTPADAARARQYLREYLELVKDPEHPGAQTARKILEKLK